MNPEWKSLQSIKWSEHFKGLSKREGSTESMLAFRHFFPHGDHQKRSNILRTAETLLFGKFSSFS